MSNLGPSLESNLLATSYDVMLETHMSGSTAMSSIISDVPQYVMPLSDLNNGVYSNGVKFTTIAYQQDNILRDWSLAAISLPITITGTVSAPGPNSSGYRQVFGVCLKAGGYSSLISGMTTLQCNGQSLVNVAANYQALYLHYKRMMLESNEHARLFGPLAGRTHDGEMHEVLSYQVDPTAAANTALTYNNNNINPLIQPSSVSSAIPGSLSSCWTKYRVGGPFSASLVAAPAGRPAFGDPSYDQYLNGYSGPAWSNDAAARRMLTCFPTAYSTTVAIPVATAMTTGAYSARNTFTGAAAGNAAASVSWQLYGYVMLSEIHDFFASCGILRNVLFDMTIILNIPSISGATWPYSTSASVATMTTGVTCPLIVNANQCDYYTTAAVAGVAGTSVATNTFTKAAVSSITAVSVAISAGQQCQLWVPEISLSPAGVQEWIRSGARKVIRWREAQAITSNTGYNNANSTVNIQNIGQGSLLNAQELFIIPFYAAGGSNDYPFLNYNSHEPFYPSPGVFLNNLSITANSLPLWRANQITYSYQMFQNAIRQCYMINGGLDNVVVSGRYDQLAWQYAPFYVIPLNKIRKNNQQMNLQLGCVLQSILVNQSVMLFTMSTQQYAVAIDCSAPSISARLSAKLKEN